MYCLYILCVMAFLGCGSVLTLIAWDFGLGLRLRLRFGEQLPRTGVLSSIC